MHINNSNTDSRTSFSSESGEGSSHSISCLTSATDQKRNSIPKAQPEQSSNRCKNLWNTISSFNLIDTLANGLHAITCLPGDFIDNITFAPKSTLRAMADGIYSKIFPKPPIPPEDQGSSF